MNYLRNRIKDISSDKVQWQMLLIIFFVGVASVFLLYENEYNELSLIRAIFCGIILLGIFFFGRDGIACPFFLYANIIIYYHDYTDFISFVIISIFCCVKRKLAFSALIIYVANILVLAQVHHSDVIRVLVHFASCYAIILIMYNCVLGQGAKRKPLNLTDDERAILDELAKGKLQKEIELFSKNTIKEKLDKAISRNNCASKDELKMLYILESHLQSQLQSQ